MVVGQEQHQNGELHFHAVIQFERKVDIRNCRHFDYNNVHPSIESVRSIPRAVRYCKKEGNWVDSEDQGEDQEEQGGPNTHNYAELALGMEQLEWMQWAAHEGLAFAYANYFWQATHGEDATLGEDYVGEGVITPALNAWQYDWNKPLVS